MKQNLRNEAIDTDNDGNPDELLQSWEDCDWRTLERITPLNIDHWDTEYQTETGANDSSNADIGWNDSDTGWNDFRG